MVKDVFVVNEGIEKRGGRLVGEEEEGAENEGLDRFLDPEEERGVLAGLGIIVPKKINRDESGEEDVTDTDCRKCIEFLVLDVVPDPVGERDGDRQAHCDVGPEVPSFGSSLSRVLAAVTEEEDGQDDVDDDVSERAVLLFGSGSGRFVRSGHFKRCKGCRKGPLRAGPWKKMVAGNLRGVNGISSGAELVASLLHAVAERLFGFLEVAAWVVALLVSDFAVDLEHSFDVLAHVSDDGAGESVLGVGVDIHLHDAVVESLLKVI